MTAVEEYPGQAEDVMHAAHVDVTLGQLAASIETALNACYGADTELHKLVDGDAWDMELAEGRDGSNAQAELDNAMVSLRHVQLVVQSRLALFDDDEEDGADPYDTVKAIGLVLSGRMVVETDPAGAKPELPEQYVPVPDSWPQTYPHSVAWDKGRDLVVCAEDREGLVCGHPVEGGPCPHHTTAEVPAEAEPLLDPVYPAPGSEIPGQPGYVVGECTHRVAGSEWRAGFRTCEHCPSEPEDEA